MLCIANEPNQKRIAGKIRTFNTGETFEFDECPEHFSAIDSPPTVAEGKVDYATMGETWLRQYDGNADELAMFIIATYPTAIIPSNATWNELVNILQVQRETHIMMVDNTGKLPNALSSITTTPDTIVVDVEVDAPPADKKKGGKKAESKPAPEVKTAEVKTAEVKTEDAALDGLSEDVDKELDELFKEDN